MGTVFGVCEQQKRRLISVFVFRFPKVLYLYFIRAKFQFVVEEIGLSLALSETPKTSFVASRPIFPCSGNLSQYSSHMHKRQSFKRHADKSEASGLKF